MSGNDPPPKLKKEALEWFGKTHGMDMSGAIDPAKSVTLEFWDFPKPSICAVNLASGGLAGSTPSLFEVSILLFPPRFVLRIMVGELVEDMCHGMPFTVA